VLLAVVLILISRGVSQLSYIGGGKIDSADRASECDRLCRECCHVATNGIDLGMGWDMSRHGFRVHRLWI